MAERSKYAVHFLLEDGIVVRGTLDAHEALAMAVGHDDDFEQRYWRASEAVRDPFDPDWTPPAQEVGRLADLCHELIAAARPGLYRWNIAQPGDDARFWLIPVAERGPGVWQGVEFRA